MSTQPFEYYGPQARKDPPATRAGVEAAKAKVQELWAHGKEYRLQTGEALLVLRKLLSKKGHGTFRDTVTAMGIPKSTAQDYIRLHQEATGVVKPKSKNAHTSGIRSFKDIHRLKQAVGEYLRLRPEDVADFRAWVSSTYPEAK